MSAPSPADICLDALSDLDEGDLHELLDGLLSREAEKGATLAPDLHEQDALPKIEALIALDWTPGQIEHAARPDEQSAPDY